MSFIYNFIKQSGKCTFLQLHIMNTNACIFEQLYVSFDTFDKNPCLFFILFIVCFLQPFLQLTRKLIITKLTNWFQVKLEKLSLLTHFSIAYRTTKMVHMPRLVKCMKHISRDDTVTGETNVSKQLMIVNLTVSQSLLLVMSSTKEWLLTLGTHKMLYMPCFAQGMNNSLFYWTPASSTYRYAHLIMTSQAIQFPIYLPCISVQLNTAGVTVEVVGMEGLSLVFDMPFFNDRVTLVAHILSHPTSLLLSITLSA